MSPLDLNLHFFFIIRQKQRSVKKVTRKLFIALFFMLTKWKVPLASSSSSSSTPSQCPQCTNLFQILSRSEFICSIKLNDEVNASGKAQTDVVTTKPESNFFMFSFFLCAESVTVNPHNKCKQTIILAHGDTRWTD